MVLKEFRCKFCFSKVERVIKPRIIDKKENIFYCKKCDEERGFKYLDVSCVFTLLLTQNKFDEIFVACI